MSRLLGIDYGSSKIGISMCDPMKIIASDFEVIFTKETKNPLRRIVEICKEYKIEYIVLGLPLNMDGSTGFQAQEVLEFKTKLESQGLRVITNDERLTTKMAEETMAQLNMSKKDIALKSDAKAASYILQNHIDYI